jgi:hypothetical protein
MNELCSLEIAAEDIRVRVVAEGDRGAVTPTTKLTRNEKLTSITPSAFFLRLFLFSH